MANKTIADRVARAINTGHEAKFYTNDELATDTEYEFTPNGIAEYVSDTGGYVTDVVTEEELVSAGGGITIPAGSTLDEALQILLDAINPA